MQQILRTVHILSMFALLLAACGSVTAVPVSTSTALPATPTLSLTVSDGPDHEIASFRLRQWTEDDYFRIMERINELASDEEGQIPEFIKSDYLVALQSEYLLRFPNSTTAKDMLWEILRNKPEKTLIPGVPPDSDPMSTLMAGLLANNIPPTQLSTELEKHDLQTLDMLVLPNMIGNGEDGYVFLIKMFGFDNVVVGVFTIFHDGNKFYVQQIREWEAAEAAALVRGFEIQNIGDKNKNNLPEMVVQIQAWSSDISKKTIDHIEWSLEKQEFQRQSFPIFWQTCDVAGEGPCEGDWEFSAVDNANILRTRSYWYGRDDCPTVAIQALFVWNNSEYISQGSQVLFPDEEISPECRLAWAETAIWLPSSAWASSDFTEGGWENDLAISIVEESLSKWTERANEIWGPAGRDHFMLQLGIWYDLRDEPDKAKAVLQQVVRNPYDKEHDFISGLARGYLDQREHFGKSKACLDLRNSYFDEFQLAIPDPSPFDNDQAMIEAWGIVASKGLYCEEYDMLPVDVKDIRGQSQQTLLQWLENNDFIVFQAVPIDLNQDGMEDYVIWLDLMDTTYDVWVFLATSTGYQPSFIVNMWPDDDRSGTKVQSMSLETGEPVYLLMLDKDLAVVRVQPDLRVETLMQEYGVQSVVTNETPASITLEIENDFDGLRTVPYLWDPRLQTFIEQPDEFTSAEFTVEKLFYTENNYEATISYIDDFLLARSTEPRRAYACGVEIPEGCRYLPDWYRPDFRYIQGVAYEQLGQAEQAKKVYYQLWQDFPENVFGLAASWKLELINP